MPNIRPEQWINVQQYYPPTPWLSSIDFLLEATLSRKIPSRKTMSGWFDSNIQIRIRSRIYQTHDFWGIHLLHRLYNWNQNNSTYQYSLSISFTKWKCTCPSLTLLLFCNTGWQAGGNDFHFTYQFGRWNQFSPTKLKFSSTKFFFCTLTKNFVKVQKKIW